LTEGRWPDTVGTVFDSRHASRLGRRLTGGAALCLALLGAVQASEGHELVDSLPPPGAVAQPLPGGAVARVGTTLLTRRSL